MSGHKFISTLLGFIESLVWLLAIGQIFQHLNNWVSYLAYPGGFAMGILVGMLIEEKLALGKVVLRVITSENLDGILNFLNSKDIRYTIISGQTAKGEERILFTVVNRDQLDNDISKIHENIPQAFYTIESVKKASEQGILPETPSRRGIGSWLTSVKRK